MILQSIKLEVEDTSQRTAVYEIVKIKDCPFVISQNLRALSFGHMHIDWLTWYQDYCGQYFVFSILLPMRMIITLLVQYEMRKSYIIIRERKQIALFHIMMCNKMKNGNVPICIKAHTLHTHFCNKNNRLCVKRILFFFLFGEMDNLCFYFCKLMAL